MLLNHLSHYTFFAQDVVKSRDEILITLHLEHTSQNLVSHMEEWNSSHTDRLSCFGQLFAGGDLEPAGLFVARPIDAQAGWGASLFFFGL